MAADMIECMTEAELDKIEIALRRRMEDQLSMGDIEAAEDTEGSIRNLNKIGVCIEEESTKGFSMMMRDRARYL